MHKQMATLNYPMLSSLGLGTSFLCFVAGFALWIVPVQVSCLFSHRFLTPQPRLFVTALSSQAKAQCMQVLLLGQ